MLIDEDDGDLVSLVETRLEEAAATDAVVTVDVIAECLPMIESNASSSLGLVGMSFVMLRTR